MSQLTNQMFSYAQSMGGEHVHILVPLSDAFMVGAAVMAEIAFTGQQPVLDEIRELRAMLAEETRQRKESQR